MSFNLVTFCSVVNDICTNIIHIIIHTYTPLSIIVSVGLTQACPNYILTSLLTSLVVAIHVCFCSMNYQISTTLKKIGILLQGTK